MIGYFPAPKPEPKAPKAPRPIARRKPLAKPTQAIGRNVAVKKRNSRRKGHRFPKNVNEAFRQFIREQACCITGLYTGDVMTLPDGRTIKVRVQATHVRSEGRGTPDAGHLVPMNQWHHHQHDQVIGPKTFAKKYDVDLLKLGGAYWTVWLSLQEPDRDTQEQESA